MIDRKALTRALGDQNLVDWVIVERDQDIAVIDEVRRGEQRTRWQITVHADTSSGRGTAHVAIDANAGEVDRLIEQAAELARLSVGSAWTSFPQAAPARVELSDPALATEEALVVADRIVGLVPRRAGAAVDPTVTLVREKVTLQTKQGFHTEWSATLARVDALVVASGHALGFVREARRFDGLDLVGAVDGAIADLRLVATAKPAPLGPCGVVLVGEALLHGGLGVWNAFVTQADAVVARQGLTRYHEHSAIAPGANQVSEPLDITSDGALAFGVLSAPLGDEGDAIRTFPIIERGIAVGLGLSPRDAALRNRDRPTEHRDPNGGVRNLVVNLGSWDERTTGHVIEVRRLRGLDIDPYTGDADLEIALGVDRSTNLPFTGGTLRLDLVEVLARARRSTMVLRRGPYDGPAAVWVEKAELV